MRRSVFQQPIRLSILLPLALAGGLGTGSAQPLNSGVAGLPLTDLFPGAQFDPAVTPLPAFAGAEPGGRPLRPEEIIAYFQLLQEQSPRARLIEYARSHEGRSLVYLAVGDEAVIADLQGFRERHAGRLDPRPQPAAGGPDGGAAAGTAVAWMAYGVHGDELSSGDAAAALAYWLVAGQDDLARRLRERLLILIDPLENPDGRARYLAQVQSFAHLRANPDQDDLSHRGVWPWGRGNHYLFDLNRDWLTLVHPESRRSSVIAEWVPQLLVDSHEMGEDATYLFPPPRHPFNPHMPASADSWRRRFSDDQAAALDRRGYPYFTGEWNEEFFPGYGSSWASYFGAVGILYEMSRTSGTLVTKRDGTVRTYAQAVEHQVASSVANLTFLADHAQEILADQIAARRQAVAAGGRGPVRAWVFPPDPRHPQRTLELAAQLQALGLQVCALPQGTARLRGLCDGRTGEVADRDVPAGTLLVRLDQPGGNLARAILDPHVPMETVFFQDERRHLEKSEGSLLYETTAWSLPLARGVPAYWTQDSPPQWPAWSPSVAAADTSAPGDFSSVIIDGDPDSAPAVLARLLQEGVTVRVARKAFAMAGRSFRPGALVMRREGNLPDLEARLRALRADLGVELVPVRTSRAQEGPDLGGDEYPVLVEPRVGILTGMPVSPSDFGYLWHLLDQDLDLRFSALDVGGFGRTDLSRYNVLVFPPIFGGTDMYRQALGAKGLERLQEWVRAGGTAVGIGGGAQLLADQDTGLTAARWRAQVLQDFPPPVWSIAAAEAEAAGLPNAQGLRVRPAAGGAEAGGRNGRRPEAAPTAPTHGSLYDVAPVIGPGARPFCLGHDQGKALAGAPLPMADWLADVLPPGRAKPEPQDIAAADRRLRSFMPQGAMLAVDLDPEFWLNFGLEPTVTVWFGGDDTLIASPPVRAAARFADLPRLHRGGLLWPEAAARMAGTAYATVESCGRGQVILFAEQPVYRRWMRDSERLFCNALLLGPGLGARWSSPW